MNRFEFVNRLNGKLYLLSESERRDIIDEYVAHIGQKMKEGKTEAEAIKDFGDIDELAREILGAYHIDSTKVADKTVDVYVKQSVDYISRAAEKILSFSTAQLARILVEFVILLAILYVLRFPMGFCGSIFTSLFSWMPPVVYSIINTVVNLFVNIITLALSLLFIYQFVNSRIINADAYRIQPKPQQAEEAKTTPVSETIRHTSEKAKQAGEKLKDKTGRAGRTFKTAAGKTGLYMKKAADRTGDFVVNLATLLIRIILFTCVWAPSALITIAGIVCTVLAIIIYATTGIGFIGICIAGVGCCIIGGSFTLWLTQTLTGGKTEDGQTV